MKFRYDSNHFTIHVEGRLIKDDFGNTVYLRGVKKHGFEDSVNGKWIDNEGNYESD